MSDTLEAPAPAPAPTPTEPTTRRLFIGNISAQLFDTPEELTSRLSRFGTLQSELEPHFNEVRGTGFGYINVSLDDKSYLKLKTSLNGFNFKGSKLVIDVAKAGYEVKSQLDRDRPGQKQHLKMLKNQWEHYKKLENIKMSFHDRRELMKGRMRASRRRAVKSMTLRVNFNGTIKVVKCHKQKLWGYEKNKRLRDLVHRFSHGVWKDGNEHIVERLTMVQLKQGSNTLSIELQKEVGANDDVILKTAVDEEAEELEVEKNTKVLASILGSFNFDKPLDYQEKIEDEFGGSDYEYNKSDLESGDDDDNNDGLGLIKSNGLKEIEYVKEGEFGKGIPEAQRIYDEDEDDDNDLYASNTYSNDHPYYQQVKPITSVEQEHEEMDVDDEEEEENEEEGEEDNEESEEEFIPTFGGEPKEPSSNSLQSNTLVEGTVSNTETLRTLFTSDTPTTFNLIEDDADIDHDLPIPEQIQLPALSTSIIPSIVPKKNKRSLFFAHLDSPFLVAQTQLSKLEQPTDFEKWDETFWEKRSEWTKDCKRRKRDVLRQMRKKNAKNSRLFL